MQAASSFIVEPVGMDVDTLPRPLNFAELFGNSNPVEIEIGSGKGTFLLDQAQSRPDVNFIGLEWANGYYRYTADRIRRAGCTNVRCARADAKFFIRELVPNESISVLHIYFPDPWPKARQQKRRTVQPSFMPDVIRILKPGGQIRVVTDHKGYWEENIEPTIKGSGLKLIDYARPGTAGEGETVGTNFERKYRREGRPFYPIAAEKSVPSPGIPGEG